MPDFLGTRNFGSRCIKPPALWLGFGLDGYMWATMK